ncbi:MAG: hypothetical protein MK212_09075 [Saprospiraceae bacterium]|nr:hypothetical protein [Saprospiraceae bacterium]
MNYTSRELKHLQELLLSQKRINIELALELVCERGIPKTFYRLFVLLYAILPRNTELKVTGEELVCRLLDEIGEDRLTYLLAEVNIFEILRPKPLVVFQEQLRQANTQIFLDRWEQYAVFFQAELELRDYVLRVGEELLCSAPFFEKRMAGTEYLILGLRGGSEQVIHEYFKENGRFEQLYKMTIQQLALDREDAEDESEFWHTVVDELKDSFPNHAELIQQYDPFA